MRLFEGMEQSKSHYPVADQNQTDTTKTRKLILYFVLTDYANQQLIFSHFSLNKLPYFHNTQD